MKSKYNNLFDYYFFSAAQDIEEAINKLSTSNTGGLDPALISLIDTIQTEWDYFTKHYLGKE